jgi:hypothetical protein
MYEAAMKWARRYFRPTVEGKILAIGLRDDGCYFFTRSATKEDAYLKLDEYLTTPKGDAWIDCSEEFIEYLRRYNHEDNMDIPLEKSLNG